MVLAPVGRIDMQTSETFRDRLMPLVDTCAQAKEPLVLDFSGIEYISSAGLRVLMLAAKQARTAGGSVAIAALQPVVREIFEISRFDKVLPCHTDVEQAVGAAAGAK
jgi:anti-anti-sigma factor